MKRNYKPEGSFRTIINYRFFKYFPKDNGTFIYYCTKNKNKPRNLGKAAFGK